MIISARGLISVHVIFDRGTGSLHFDIVLAFPLRIFICTVCISGGSTLCLPAISSSPRFAPFAARTPGHFLHHLILHTLRCRAHVFLIYHFAIRRLSRAAFSVVHFHVISCSFCVVVIIYRRLEHFTLCILISGRAFLWRLSSLFKSYVSCLCCWEHSITPSRTGTLFHSNLDHAHVFHWASSALECTSRRQSSRWNTLADTRTCVPFFCCLVGTLCGSTTAMRYIVFLAPLSRFVAVLPHVAHRFHFHVASRMESFLCFVPRFHSHSSFSSFGCVCTPSFLSSSAMNLCLVAGRFCVR